LLLAGLVEAAVAEVEAEEGREAAFPFPVTLARQTEKALQGVRVKADGTDVPVEVRVPIGARKLGAEVIALLRAADEGSCGPCKPRPTPDARAVPVTRPEPPQPPPTPAPLAPPGPDQCPS
jgi:hypothetical protein